MKQLQLHFSMDKFLNIYPTQIGFEGSLQDIYPNFAPAVGYGPTLKALIQLCVEHAIWVEKKGAPADRPFATTSLAASSLHSSNRKKASWLKLIFGVHPKGRYLINGGSIKSGTRTVQFDPVIEVSLFLNGKPMGEEVLRRLPEAVERFKNSFSGPILLLWHYQCHSGRTQPLRRDSRKGFAAQCNDEFTVSAITLLPNLLSIIWIDSTGTSSILASAVLPTTKGFTFALDAPDNKITVDQVLEIDDSAGVEMAIALYHKRSFKGSEKDALIKSLKDVKSKVTIIPRFKAVNHIFKGDVTPMKSYLTVLEEYLQKHRIWHMMRPKSNEDSLLHKEIRELMKPWAIAYDILFIPHE